MRRLFIVGAKIVGLVCILWATTTIFQIVSYFGIAFSNTPYNSFWYILIQTTGIIAYLILLAWISITLLFKTEWLADKVKIDKDGDLPNWPEPNTLLNLGIILLGLYTLASAAPNLGRSVFSSLGQFFWRYDDFKGAPNDIFRYFIPLLMDIVSVGIGLIFVLMPARLVSVIDKCQKKTNHKIIKTVG